MAQEVAGVLAAALAATAVIVAWTPASVGETIVRGLLPGFAIALVGFMYSGYTNSYDSIPNRCFLWVAAAPLTMAVAALPGLRRRNVWLRAGLTMVAL